MKFLTRVGRVKREPGIYVPDRVFDPATFAKGDALVVSDTGKDEPSLRRSVIDPMVSRGLPRSGPRSTRLGRDRAAHAAVRGLVFVGRLLRLSRARDRTSLARAAHARSAGRRAQEGNTP